MRIVETDNFARDYPNETFLALPSMTEKHATAVADAINRGFPENSGRFWKVVEDEYVLQPGFEP